jgi:hypothetical protein
LIPPSEFFSPPPWGRHPRGVFFLGGSNRNSGGSLFSFRRPGWFTSLLR